VTLGELKGELEASGELHLRVKVVPKSSRSELAGFMADGTLKAKVQAPPERGKANAELCALLAKHLGVRPRDVDILSGETSPLKQVRISRQFR
jgi:uncharacterized protein (TIGR00251 family)